MQRVAGIPCSRFSRLACPGRLATAKAGWYEGKSEPLPRKFQPATGGGESRGGGEQGRSRAPVGQPRSPRVSNQERQDPHGFRALHSTLCEGQQQNFVIRSEAWPKLFSLISNKEDADLAMALMLQDARIREANNWDWVTHGYGQTIFQLVKAAGAAGAFHVCSWILEHSSTLRLTVNNDTIPNCMRKFGAVQADAVQMEKLYELERTVRGKNTNAGFYELCRAYKRSGSVRQLEALLKSATAAGVQIKEDVLEDVESWLQKRR